MVGDGWGRPQEEKYRYVPRQSNEEMLALLWNPLPRDLPPGNKDLLIVMAAYYGNVDRYERLRRPMYVSPHWVHEACIVRGIHHNTMFAKWWSLQQTDSKEIHRAINARFIMNNDLSRITDDTPDEALPSQIWYPLRAQPATYVEYARRKPRMKPEVARALIVCNYQNEWDELDFEPFHELITEAAASPNPHYLRDLQRRCKERGIEHIDPNREQLKVRGCDYLAVKASNQVLDPSSDFLPRSLTMDNVLADESVGEIYNGYGVDASSVELFAAASEDLRRFVKDAEILNLSKLYKEYAQSHEGKK